MEKQYGLIIPGAQKKPIVKPTTSFNRAAVFNESSSNSEDDDFKGPQRNVKPKVNLTASAMERRKARTLQEKAIAEDPTVYQYDELYDEMETHREEEITKKSNEPKKPKYIGKLLEFAQRRKLENELRVERQVQKEREQEGEEFQDKEKFVTQAYRKKLEEMRKLVELEKQDDYLESIGDVTKQKDLDGFYRHIYEQKLGTSKEILKPKFPEDIQKNTDKIDYVSIKSGNSQKQRAYRKRRASEEDKEEEEPENIEKSENVVKKHLENNIDADSDFSIDSSSSEDENDNKETNNKNSSEKNKKIIQTKDFQNSALNLENLKKEDNEEKVKEKSEDEQFKKPKEIKEEKEDIIEEPVRIKKDKSEIWKKRTIGDVFDAAVQRYYERKAARRA